METKGAKLQMMDKYIHDTLEGLGLADTRYNTPKELPKVPNDIVDKAIEDNYIYSEVRQLMLDAQRKQVAYGLEKYPETLNENSWGHIETIEHIIEETIDQLHYLVMLKTKMKKVDSLNKLISK